MKVDGTDKGQLYYLEQKALGFLFDFLIWLVYRLSQDYVAIDIVFGNTPRLEMVKNDSCLFTCTNR